MSNKEVVARHRFAGNLETAIARLHDLVIDRMPDDFDVRTIERDSIGDLIESLAKLLDAEEKLDVSSDSIVKSFVIPVDPKFISSIPKAPKGDYVERVYIGWIEEGYLFGEEEKHLKKMPMGKFSEKFLKATMTNPRWSWIARKVGANNKLDTLYLFVWDLRSLPIVLFPKQQIRNEKGRRHPGHAEALAAIDEALKEKAKIKIVWKIPKKPDDEKPKLKGINGLFVTDCKVYVDKEKNWCAEILGDERI
jgi:hypothetical protein